MYWNFNKYVVVVFVEKWWSESWPVCKLVHMKFTNALGACFHEHFNGRSGGCGRLVCLCPDWISKPGNIAFHIESETHIQSTQSTQKWEHTVEAPYKDNEKDDVSEQDYTKCRFYKAYSWLWRAHEISHEIAGTSHSDQFKFRNIVSLGNKSMLTKKIPDEN